MKTIRRERGVTLIESAVVTAIVAIVAGTVVPGMQQLRERHRVDGSAALLETDLQLARSTAVARYESVRVSFTNAEACYVVHTGDDCHCGSDGSAVCAPGSEALRVAALEPATRLTLRSNSASILFDAVKGTVTPTASIEIAAPGGASQRVIVNIMGRVRSCVPGGEPAC